MSNLQNNIASLEALITKANALPEEKTIQSSKTVTPTTSSQTVKPDSGYDGMGQVVVNAMPTATQATPSVSIDSAGKITATATQSAGYVAAGTKTGTKQLTTQAAKTITPTKSSQTAVAKNVYTTGAVTVAAIPSQYITTTDASAAADDIVTGETAYVNGVKVTGTNPYEKTATDTEVAAQATQIEEIMGLLEGKSVPGGSDVEMCKVTVDGCRDVIYTTVENGEFVTKLSQGTSATASHEFTACRNLPFTCGYLNYISSQPNPSVAVSVGRYANYYQTLLPVAETVSIVFNGGGGGND